MAKIVGETSPLTFGTEISSLVSPERIGDLLKKVGPDPRNLADMLLAAEDRVKELLSLLPQEKDERMTRDKALKNAAKAIKEAGKNPDLVRTSGYLDIADYWIRLASVMES